MPGTIQGQLNAKGKLHKDGCSGFDEILVEALRTFTGRLDSSRAGVCLYDKSLACKAANAGFARMNGVSVRGLIGRNLHQILGEKALELETVIQKVWKTGSSYLNFSWTAGAHSNTPEVRWLVNFYPIENEEGQIRLIAMTFFEVTKRVGAELRPEHLADKDQANVRGERNVFGEEFTELPARSVDLVKRSVELLKNSVGMRRYASETRIGAGLARLALSLNGIRQLEFMLPAMFLVDALEAEPLEQFEPDSESRVPAGGPSPRERQLLRLLADGKSNKEIGAVLDISTRTVETYRARIMIKLNLHSTAALVRYAIREKIIEA